MVSHLRALFEPPTTNDTLPHSNKTMVKNSALVILLCIINQAISSQQTHYHKPTTSILAVKELYPTISNDRIKDDFARLNKINKYGGPITRESVSEAIVKTKSQRPSQDIVVMGVASWN